MEHQNVKTSKISWKFALCWAVILGNPYSIGVRMAPKRGFLPESRCLEVSLVRGLVAQLVTKIQPAVQLQQLSCWRNFSYKVTTTDVFLSGSESWSKKKGSGFWFEPCILPVPPLGYFFKLPWRPWVFWWQGERFKRQSLRKATISSMYTSKIKYIYNIHWVTFINFIGTQNTCHISNHRWYLKQAGACGRRPGQFLRGGVSVVEAHPPDTYSPTVPLKTQKSWKLYSWFPFLLILKKHFAILFQLYQIELVGILEFG